MKDKCANCKGTGRTKMNKLCLSCDGKGEIVFQNDSGCTIKDTRKFGSYLKSEPCHDLGCEKSEFLCYPDSGICHCGVAKSHVHCKNCGGTY